MFVDVLHFNYVFLFQIVKRIATKFAIVPSLKFRV